MYQQFIPINTNTKIIIFRNFCWWRVLFAVTSLPRKGVHWLYKKETWARKQSLSRVINRWIIFRLKVVSFITNNDNSWPTFLAWCPRPSEVQLRKASGTRLQTFPACNRFRWHELKLSFCTLYWLLERCLLLLNCFSIAGLFQRCWNKISQKYSQG